MIVETQAVVLKTLKYGDTSKIVTLYSRRYGLLEAYQSRAGLDGRFVAARPLSLEEDGALYTPPGRLWFEIEALSGARQTFRFRLEPGDTGAKTKVQVGRRAGDRVEITDGLPPEAKVVAGGAAFLTDGDAVRVVEGEAAAVPERP